MKRITILAAGLALLLTGCATNYDAYVKAQVAIIEAQSAAETNRLVAMTKIAESGDATVKAATVMGLALTGNKQMTTLQAPVDPVLQWASILVPSLTNVYGIRQNTTVQLANIESETAQYGATLGTLGAISIRGMEEAGKVTFPPVYTVPLGSAPAPAVPAVTP